MQGNFLRFVFLIALWLIFILPLRAQVLKGVVVDGLTGQSLLEAEVAILNSPFSSITNLKGEFWIEPITEEWVRIEISRHGFERKEVDLKVNPNDTTEVQLHLLPAIATLNEGVVITAHRYAREAIRTATSISRMGREKFRQYNPRTVPEAIMGTPGIWLQESDPATSNLYLRGLTGHRTLLMIDGIRVNQSAFGEGNNTLLNTIDPFSVNEIEIIRGGASTQFGTDAMGGISQVFTRTPGFSGKGVQVHGGGSLRYLGSGLERSAHGEFQVNSPVVAVHAGLSLRDFGNRIGGRTKMPILGTSYQERAADLKALVKISPKQLLTVAYQSMRQEEINQYEKLTYFNYKTYQIQPRERELAYARYAAYTDLPWLKEIVFTGSFQQLAQTSEKEQRGSDFREREENYLQTWGGNLEIHSQPGLYWKAVSGLDFYKDLLESEGQRFLTGQNEPRAYQTALLDGSTFNQLGIYSLHTVDLLNLRLSFGGRGSAFWSSGKDLDFGALEQQNRIWSGNIGAQYPLHPNFYLTTAVQSGFRAPNLLDMSALGRMESGITAPADSLNPERSLTSQFGLKAKTEFFSGTIVFYRTRLKDLIELLPGSYLGSTQYEGQDVFQLRNQGRALIQGVEAEVEVPVSRAFVVYGNVVYTHGQYLSKDEPFSRIPPFNSRMGLHLRSRYGVWSRVEWLHAEAQKRLSQEDLESPFIAAEGTPGWDVFNLYLGYDFQWGYATFGVRNVLDTPYLLHGSALERVGRAVLLSLQLGF